jgi:hypothetical protein
LADERCLLENERGDARPEDSVAALVIDGNTTLGAPAEKVAHGTRPCPRLPRERKARQQKIFQSGANRYGGNILRRAGTYVLGGSGASYADATSGWQTRNLAFGSGRISSRK